MNHNTRSAASGLTAALALLLLVGCNGGTRDVTTLKENETGGLVLTINPFSRVYALEVLTTDPTAGCASLPDAHEQFENAEIPQTAVGGQDPDSENCGNGCVPWCDAPTWSAPRYTRPVSEESSTFTLSDASATWTMTVLNLYAPRTVVLAQAATVHLGDTVNMTWSPATDVVKAPNQITVSLLNGDGSLNSWPSIVGTYDAGAISFVVPSDRPAGQYLISLEGVPTPAVSVCSGPADCWVGVSDNWSTPTFMITVE